MYTVHILWFSLNEKKIHERKTAQSWQKKTPHEFEHKHEEPTWGVYGRTLLIQYIYCFLEGQNAKAHEVNTYFEVGTKTWRWVSIVFWFWFSPHNTPKKKVARSKNTTMVTHASYSTSGILVPIPLKKKNSKEIYLHLLRVREVYMYIVRKTNLSRFIWSSRAVDYNTHIHEDVTL